MTDLATDAAQGGRLPIRMLHDRLLVTLEGEGGERHTGGGLLIPATASLGKRLTWGVVVAVGPNARQVKVDDRVLFDAEDRAEVELQGRSLVLLREKDIHAVAARRVEGTGQTGLYL